jgi:hypothetical protein
MKTHNEIQKQFVLLSIYDLHRIRTDSDNRLYITVQSQTSIYLEEDRSSISKKTYININNSNQSHTVSALIQARSACFRLIHRGNK